MVMGAQMRAIKGLALVSTVILGKRVMLQHQFRQALVQDMRIDFCRRDVGVTKQGLDRTQIGPIGQKMRRKGMAQRVWRDFVRRYTTLHGQFLYQCKEPVSGQVP